MRTTLFALSAFFLLATASDAQAAKLIGKSYRTANRAARSAAAYVLNKYPAALQTFDPVRAKHLVKKGEPQKTASGRYLRFHIVTRRKAANGAKPFAEVVPVTVFKAKDGKYRVYKPSKKRAKVNGKETLRSLIPEGWIEVGMEDWIETYGAEGQRQFLPNGNVAVPDDDGWYEH